MSVHRFRDRREAGRRLAAGLAHLRAERPVVLGLPRGGVPVADEVAAALDAQLDVIVVRKLGVPSQPELGMGAIGEDGVRVLNDEVVRLAGVSEAQLRGVEAHEREELERRARRFRDDRPMLDLTGRTVVVVDDGIATGGTARAALLVARAHGAARVVLAVPVAPAESLDAMREVADEVVALDTPWPFYAVGEWYDDFSQTTDDEVVQVLQEARARPAGDASGSGSRPAFDDEVSIPVGPVRLAGHLAVPRDARGVVVFAHGSGSSRFSSRNILVADVLHDAGLATLLFDLLTEDEALDRENVFDVELLASRLAGALAWVGAHPATTGLDVGAFGASTGAAAALWAAAEPASPVRAVVSRGGRPDLAGPRLAAVRAPTLLVVGGHDHVVLELNEQAARSLRCEHRLEVVPGATHLFEEPGTLEAAADLARDWFVAHLGVHTPRPDAQRGGANGS